MLQHRKRFVKKIATSGVQLETLLVPVPMERISAHELQDVDAIQQECLAMHLWTAIDAYIFLQGHQSNR